MSDQRIELLHEMLLAPLQTSMHELGVEAAKRMPPAAEPSFHRGAWHGYKLACEVFERWFAMTSSTCKPQRFAIHSNPSDGLKDGVVRIGDYREDKLGLWYGEKEDGGSCRG